MPPRKSKEHIRNFTPTKLHTIKEERETPEMTILILPSCVGMVFNNQQASQHFLTSWGQNLQAWASYAVEDKDEENRKYYHTIFEKCLSQFIFELGELQIRVVQEENDVQAMYEAFRNEEWPEDEKKEDEI